MGDSCWSVRMVYGPKGLSRISTAGPKVDGVLQIVSEPSLAVSQACVVSGSCIWHMAHVGLEWSHGMAYDDTRHTDVAKRRGSCLGVGRRGRRSSKGVGL
jgi:hypothetical protein